MDHAFKLRFWDDKLKRDVTDAINLLMQMGKIDPETFFEFATVAGNPRVLFWLVDAQGNTILGSTANIDPVDLIVAADTRELESGRRFHKGAIERV